MEVMAIVVMAVIAIELLFFFIIFLVKRNKKSINKEGFEIEEDNGVIEWQVPNNPTTPVIEITIDGSKYTTGKAIKFINNNTGRTTLKFIRGAATANAAYVQYVIIIETLKPESIYMALKISNDKWDCKEILTEG